MRANTRIKNLSALALCLTYGLAVNAARHGRAQHKHKPRDQADAVADIIVWVNEQNEPVSTATVYQTADPTAAATTSEDGSSSGAFHANDPVSAVIPNPSAASSSLAGQNGFSLGVTYSPYNADHSCKSQSAVAADLASIQDYQVVRLYGTDCDQVSNVAKALGDKAAIFAGFFDLSNIQSQVETLSAGINGNWKSVVAVSVGNELVNSGQASPASVISAMTTARAALKAKGYNGPVTTVDTMMAMQSHPELCTASDFCAINCHAFFDGNVLPENAGNFVSGWVSKIKQAAGGNKRVVVTESGWPTAGSSNNQAVPGQSQQQKAIQSLKGAIKNDLILYTLYNDGWKSDNPSTFNAEKHWGLRG